MLKRVVLALAVVSGMWAGSAQAQVDPNGGGAAGPGGFQIDPAMADQIQQMQQMGQQIQQNMQNAGMDPQQFFQDQIQSGNFDPQAMQQALVDRGVMTQDQATQMSTMMNNLQQGFQQQMQNNPDFQNFRQNMILNNIRQQMGVASDDEWNVLLPKLQRLLSALTDVQLNNNGQMSTVLATNRFGGGGFGQGGGAGFGQGGAPAAAATPPANETPIAKAWRELSDVVQDNQAPDSQIAAKLAAWRTLHESAVSKLETCRTDLVQVLTLRQEAVLLWMGVL